MGRAPVDTDWGLLGSSLAFALPMLPLHVRLGLQDGVSREALWGFVVEAIARAEYGDTLSDIRAVRESSLAACASEWAWVAHAMSGLARTPRPLRLPTFPRCPSVPAE